MPTHDTTGSPSRTTNRIRWVTPLVSVAIGLAYLVAGWLGDDLTFGVIGLAVMLVTGAAFLVLSRYSETVAGLLDRRDERINRIDTDATTIAGMAVGLAVIIGLIVEIAQGKDGMPYAMLGAIGGVAYLAAVIALRLRR